MDGGDGKIDEAVQNEWRMESVNRVSLSVHLKFHSLKKCLFGRHPFPEKLTFISFI